MNKIIRLVMGLIVTQFILLFVFLAGSHMFQLAMPRAYWYTYNSVEPSKGNYEIGEPIYGVSDVIRRREIETQRQDTLFCNNGERVKKYPTQYRPPIGREIPKLGHNNSEWLYDYKVGDDEQYCHLCGTVVAETEYGYSKNYQYCTKWFGVNGNRIEDVESLAILKPASIIGYYY